MEYYQKIRNVREDMDLKQYEFAKLIHVLPKTYNLYENGLRQIPFRILNRILKELNLSLDYILGFSEASTYPDLKGIRIHALYKNLRIFRKKMGLSQKEMAALLNCNQQTLSEYERGNLTIPLPTFKKFCEVTRVSADTIAGRTKEIRILEKIPN